MRLGRRRASWDLETTMLVVSGSWLVVRGSWFVVSGSWLVVRGRGWDEF